MTKSIVEFVRHLTNLSIELKADGDRLRCHAPEGVLTPALRQEIAARKAEILLFLQQAQQVKTSHQSPIQRVPRDGVPLSFAQQRLWFLHHLSPDSRSYNLLDVQRLHGSLNIVALEKSLAELIRRHEILRTTFPTVDGQPIQVIAPANAITLPVYNLQGLSPQEETEQIEQIVQSLASQAFDLAVGPLQFTLLQLSEQEYILVSKMHHIIYDGWSLNIFKNELSQLYVAFAQGLPNPLAELSIQYADFAVWQRQWLTGEVLERQLNYWEQQLADAPVAVELPTDKPHPPVQTFRGGVERFKLDSNLTQRLKQLSQESDATLFMTLLAAFLVLISRYSNQLDIVVGSPIANRNNKSVEQLIGFFANTLALRGDLSGNPSFADFLAQVRQTTLSAYAHQDLPFEMLVEKLQPERDLSRNPLVQVMFSLQITSQSFWDLPGLTIQKMSLPVDEMVRFDLEVNYWEVSGGLEGVWSYSADLFDAATIARIAQNFQTLLQAIVANPKARIAELPLLTTAERHQLLVEWNNTGVDYSQDKCIHQLFEEQVERTPDALAVVFKDVQTRAFASLTYQQLNTRANGLAHYLKSLGVGADVLVGLCVERSLEMIVGLLGILKAGGAYVPLDPDYPQERLSFMLEDAQVRVLLTQQQLIGSLPKHQARVICLDSDWETIAQNSLSNPENTATPDNLAYVIYTSGSTGKPKGVLVNHNNVTRLFAATDSWYKFNSDDVWTMFHSYAFDFSVWEIWGALLYGGRLVVVPYLVTRSPESFYQLLAQEKVTILNQTPSAFRQLIQTEQSITAADSLSLRLVIFGGEALELGSLQPWFERHGDTIPQLVNMYGITETTVHVTYRPLSKADLQSTASVIGRPIPDLQVYVLDEHLHPVPIGVPGEMYVGGEGLARGYLNRLQLTQQKFISHPFSNNSQARLYKTGDKARYLPNGELEYLGRIDNQVKIRGFRIELGEIEAALASHPGVWESVVVVREDELGDRRLVAYIVPQVEKSPTPQQLRQFLKAKLPEYMVPSAMVLLESLPLTPNGKVDRRVLPKPELNSKLLEKYVAPRTPIEEMLAQIWAQVLKVEQVGIHDNFFELGGHSLLATQLVSRIRNIFKVELPLRDLFTRATVAQLAQLFGQLQQQNLELHTPLIVPRAENIELPLSFSQQRLWFLDQLQPNSSFYNIPVALRILGTLNQAALEQSLQEIIARHEALRTNFIAIDGKPTQTIQQQTNWTVDVVQLQHLPNSEKEIATKQLAQQQATQSFDLAQGALVRSTLVVLSETEHVLLLCMHHIVSDGWSMGVFIEELAALYNAYSTGQPSPLAPLPVQYADFALWQRQWLQGNVLQSQLSYWQQQLANAPTLLPLPTDRPRPAVQTFSGAYQKFPLSVELTNKLVKLSQEQGATLFMMLLAAFDTLLYRYTGQEDILVGSPIANRDRSEIEGLIGFFVNTLVMRTDLADNPSFSELLTRVRDMAMQAYTHQDLPLEMLLEALQPERDLSHTPLFQVMFSLQDTSISELELTGLTVNHLKIEGITAKFDLTLLMQNTSTGLVGVWEYNTDLFDASTIERMTGHFVTLLEGIIANPEERISQLPLLTPSEQQQLLVEWNDTQADYPLDKCIHQLFEEQVERTPDAVAVVFEKQQLTYHQLNCRANQLAHYLKFLEVGADVLVGICVERSIEMVVGLLGILKAGGAYLPLDPEYPTERLRFMLEDAQVPALLTQQRLVDRLAQQKAHLVCLDTDTEVISQFSQDNPIPETQATNLAYVIYTSGSTGQPKGVLIAHQGLLNLVFWHQRAFKITPLDRATQLAGTAFDAAVWELWPYLTAGASIYLVKTQILISLENLRDWLISNKITISFLPTPLAEELLSLAWPTEGLALRTILTGGDKLHQYSSELIPFQVVNNYGPTENTVVTTSGLVVAKEQQISPSIGRAIANTQIYILDRHLQPVPVGVPGELHIGGVGLARGYLNRDELTQERFINNPFAAGRLYKTGDLARYLADGNIEYLGRIDNQVKIRGYRIELGEIEAALNQNEYVQASCVIPREVTRSDKRLVAYIVPHQGSTPTISELRQYLKTKLPDYMVPNAVVILEFLPLTPNGKVDRRALPKPDLGSTEQYVAPRTPIEEILAQIWAQVLKVEPVGIHDNFFELGGHSLLATQLLSRIRNIFKVELPLRDLFAAPTITELAHLIGQLQQQNIELTSPPILRRAKDAELPLSFAQTRLWFLDQFEPNTALYNIPIALRLVGTLNQAALEQSLIEIIHRHEALRTNFIAVDGQPTQIIQTQTNWTVSVVDLQHLSTAEQAIAAQELAQQQATQPFELATQALVRATLVVLTETECVFLVCMHHIVSDGWSMGVFVQELASLYNAYSQGQPSLLMPLMVQYADFALWQRQWLQGDVLQSQLDYWQKQLADAPTLLALPTDRPRPAVQTFAGAYQKFALSVELTEKLKKLSQERGVTLFMTLLAAFDTLLYRYTGQEDILVGSPIANRDHSELEGLIGFFVNTLVLRTNVSGNSSFSELLGRVRAMAIDAYVHQDLPFEMLVEALQPERDLSHAPLIQVMFVLENGSTSQLELAGLTVSPLVVESATAKFDLTLGMENTVTGLVGAWEYNTDLFDASTIERLTAHFVTLLEGIIANPQERISQLPLLTTTEQQQLLVEWNNTQADYPGDKCIHQLFEEQVERTPDAVAVVFEGEQLTYQQLNTRTNQLADYLRLLGVGADVLVGICVDRSIEMVVGLLGILKAGGAYVPLDPEYPIERLRFMLEDAQVPVLLTQQHLVEKLPEHKAHIVYLDTDAYEFDQASEISNFSEVKPSNLAYVLYTSGSTGRPKAVAIEHHSPVALVSWAKEVFTPQELAGVLASTSLCFDLSIFELFVTLSVGGKVILAQNALHLSTMTAANQVTLINTVPSAIAQLIRDDRLPQQVCTVNLAGEPLQNQLVQQIYQRSQVKRVFNLYGPSEDTTYSTFSLIEQGATTSPTIGRPISNTQIYILDRYLQPVPVGVAGELHIGGAGLARGYLNHPELTQEKFIPNPFDADRVYKTGDLARYLPDGNIEYLGRIDNQVKIRGFRIELGEVEAVLSQHSDVQASCTITREDTPGDKRLVAYIVPKQGFELSISQLRSFLSGQLPQYMVPHTFVILESLPLTPNGKIDRRALPEPNSLELLEDCFVAPRNQIEEILTQIWAEVLRIKQVGIYDNFFELGGDSILSIQILAKAKQTGLQLSLKQLFGNQTIAQLATVAGTIEAIDVEQGLVTGTLPLTPIQHWFFEQNLSQPHHFNQAFLLSVPSDLKPELLKQALQQLLVHHDTLRLRFTQSDSTWQQIYSAPNDSVAFSYIDLLEFSESEQQTAIEDKAASLQASLNLSENLVQVAFFHLGIDKRARLLIVIHHLVIDGVSWRILLEDLQTAYQQLAQGKAIVLSAKTTSLKDWSENLTEYAQSETLKSEVAYWLKGSRSAIPSIPVDYIRGANTVASANTVLVSLSEAETRALLQDVPKAYNTQINDVLLTALVLVLSRWTNSKCVLFNLEGHGREDIVDGVDLSRTVGWFTTIFPVLLELEATENPADALKSVKEQLRAIPNKGIGYGLLRYLSQDAEIVTKLQAFSQAQISFNYLGQFDQVLNTSTWMQLANESAGVEHSLDNNRAHLLDINSIIAGEQLQINWLYSTNVHQQTTIENLAQEFVKTLRELIAHCLAPQNGGYTPSDFPLVKLAQQKLDQLLASPALKQGLEQTNWQNIEDIYPLSPTQQGMLFESLYAPDSGVYFEQVICTLTGNLDVTAFEKAWQQVVARHSILRTGFVWEQLPQTLQVVYRQVKVNVEVYSWQKLSAQEQQQQLELFLQSQRQQSFQLSQAPLMRLHLIQLSTNSYQFVWSHHHLLLDGWSLPLVFQDLLYFYQAISQGKSFHYQSAANYRNYIAWLQQQDSALAEQFWRQKLQGFTTPTPLTVDRLLSNKENGISYREQQIQLTVPATAAVRSFVRQHQLTISNLVQATWAILLCRYSQETDVVFGATVSGRPPSLVGIESMVGLFINTLPVRIQVSSDTQLLDLLKDLQAQQVESEQYSYSSLADIQGLSEVPRGMSLFESIVVFENYPVDATMRSQNYGFDIDNIHGIEQTNYPLTVVAIPREQLLVKISYDTSRFDHATIARMLDHFQTLLEGIITTPEARISQLPLLTPSEQQQLIVDWNDTSVDYPVDKCIHQLFEEQVDRTPDAVVVVFENQQLTYQQLNTRANQLAYYLRSLGVGADVLVGLCVERSIEMVVGILGILKAGGAYIPLDPTYPQERLAYMLNDSQVRVLLTQEKLVTGLPEHGARVVCLDTNWEDISTESQDNPISDLAADNLAYVIYTSGSTGKPKGVLVNHNNVTRLFAATDSWYQFNSDDVWTMFHSYAFDFSVWEIWGALLYGGRLVVVPYLVTRSPESFYQLLCKEKVTVLNQTPSAFRQLIQAEQLMATTAKLNLRLVIFGGEALELGSLQPWFERHGDTIPQLVNMYGITETTVHVTYRPLSKADLQSTASVIGRPIPDLQVYVLDEHLHPVPIGVPGEMYVGGEGVTCGYLNRPELTQQRFISNPFTDKSKARLYKTGDKARYLPNGELEYLGRIDNQVKIRGFRIELGEIEALLASHPDVWESVVVVREDEPGDKRLVAYVIPQAEQSPTTAQLRRFLTNQLPSYMVPSAFVKLAALPLTANGKIDRRALPAPDSARPELEDVFVAPSTIEEKILAAIWAKVLGVEQVGINDNFFTLGGDSIRSIQVLSEAKEQGLSFSVQQLFQHQTISQLVQELKTQEQNFTKLESTQPLSLISSADKQRLPDGVEDAYPLAMLQTGMLYHSEYNKDSALYHEISSFHLKTPLDVQLLQVAVQDLVNHHAVLRTSFDLSNFSIPMQLVHQQVELPLQVEDWCHLNHSQQEEALAAWFEAEKKRHFDWTHAPLLRFFVHRRTQETFNLTWSCHHAILDGWSVSSMMTDLFSRYLSLLGERVDYVSPPLSIAYRDFVALEQQAIASSTTQQYWNEKLHDSTFTKIPHWSSISTDADVREVGIQDVTLSPQISKALKQLAQSAEVPFKSVLLAAHLRVLNLLGGQSDVLTGLVANGRPEQSDGERVLGLFLNTLPFRLELTGGRWIDLVQQVFAAEREMLPHRRYPLAEIQRNLGGESLFETAFNFVHFHVYQQVLGLDNLQILGGKFFEQTNFTFAAQFSVNLRSSELELRLQYDALKLCPEQINRISEYYLNALVAIANQPQGRYELHPLVSEQEQHQLLVAWNHTQADYSQDKCIHELFEAQVERTPDAVAVVCDNQQLTYQQLNYRVNQLAHYLRSLGVGADVLVGLCVERSLDMLVGLLGILKAGGAYLPLDPSYPQDRLSFMLEDAQVGVLITQQHLVERLTEHQTQLVCLDTNSHLISKYSQDKPITGVDVTNLAYVIYTSGSTGRPKGVMISHGAIANHCCIMQENYGLVPSDRVLQFSSINFDPSLEQIFLPLMVGATLLVRGSDVWTPTELHKIILDFGLTVINLPTAYWQQTVKEWVTTQIPDKNSQLRLVIVGGEAMLPEYVSLWQQLPMSGVRLFNAYGPTEATITATLFEIPPHFNEDTNLITVPIGRPVINKTTYILDAHLQPVPVGVSGELYISGNCLAQGYLNRPELTNEKFIPNPFRADPDSRLYKTGDLARYLPDGNIEYLGRIDDQVKVRGFRIELGEIEAVLSQHDEVQASCVIVREDIPGDKRLVAYIVPQKEVSPTSNELWQFLKIKLPEYMIPNAFVFLEALPLTPNGKIDRRALPAPSSTSNSDRFVAPRNRLELQLAQLWLKILKVDKVGVQDNFLDLGGHSLVAIYLMAQIKQQFGKDISLKTFLQNSTIEQLATIVQKNSDDSSESCLVAIQPHGSKLPLFCLPGAGGTPFYLYDLARCLGQDQPFYSFQASSFSEGLAAPTQVEDIAAQYIQALQVVQPQGPYLLAGHSFGGKVAFEMSQQLLHKGHEVALVAIVDSTAPFYQEKPMGFDWDNAKWLVEFARSIERFLAKNLDITDEILQSLVWQEQLEYVLQRLKMVDILPPDADSTQLNNLVQVLKSNSLMNYVPQQIYPTRITLLRSSEASAEEPTGELPSEILQDSAWGWNKFSAEPVDVQFVPGNHTTMMTLPHVQVLTERLKAYIDKANI